MVLPNIQTLPQAPRTAAGRPLPRVIAAGAWLKNTAGRLDGAQWQGSPVHGDLDDPSHCVAFEASLELLRALGPIDAIVHDLHPDFHSSRVAQALARQLGVPAIAVQHYHAHIAAVQAEAGLLRPVIGLALDGVGLGTDGQAWGGELLWVDGARWRRLGHLSPLALPGGDIAATQPWRMAAAVLHALGRSDEIARRYGPAVGASMATMLATMLARRLQCPMTSSAGRWFDAAAGALGLSLRQEVEAEAAMALERHAEAALARGALQADPSWAPIQDDGCLDLHPLLAHLFRLADSGRAERVDEGAALFHLGLADGLARWAIAAASCHDTDTVVLGGGCFYNRVLGRTLVARLERAGRCLAPRARRRARPYPRTGDRTMCLALPARVISLEPHGQAVVELGGVRKTVSVELVPQAVVGDHVIVHVGHAIGMIDTEEAARTLALFGELSAAQQAAQEATP